MRNSTLLASAVAAGMASSALATITGTSLFGDSYLVVDGAKTYSVMDVYIKSNNAADIVSSVYGVSAFKASWVQNQSKSFKHAGNSSWNPNYTDAAGASWDSFVTTGMRTQSNDGYGGTAIGLTNDPGFSNMNSANAIKITGATTGNGPGWYPAAGANPATNPYASVGYYNGSSNLAKATSTITGNGIAAGGSLDNMFMIARLAIDTADMTAPGDYNVTIKLCMTGVSNGATVTGSTNANFRSNTTLTFAAVPAPGAAALVAIAGLVSRRRK